MTPCESFVQAILDSPGDTPRLVFADWLEENGEAERAEFVRVQVELGRLPDGPRREELQRREQELLAAYRAAWLAPLGLTEGQAVFRRGFVEEVLLGVTAFLQRADVLCRAEPVGVLRVRPAEAEIVSLRELFASPHAAQLRELDLNGREHLPPMWTGSWRIIPTVGEDDLDFLLDTEPPPRLEVLRLARNEIGNLGAAMLASSPWLARLTTLDLAGNYFGPEGCQALLNSPHPTRLACLDLSGIQEYNMYTEDVRTLPNVGEEGVVALAQSPPGRLRRLNLAFNRVGDRGVEALAGAAALESLEWLNVYEEHDGPALLGPGESLTEAQQSALRRRFGARVHFRGPGQESIA